MTGEYAEEYLDAADFLEAQEQLEDALSEPPWCGWCNGTCKCDDWGGEFVCPQCHGPVHESGFCPSCKECVA